MGALTGASLGDCADEVRLVLVKAMQEKPAARYSTAGDFAADLAVAAGLPEPTVAAAPGIVAAVAAITPVSEPAEERAAKLKPFREESEKMILKLLTEEQQKKLPQLRVEEGATHSEGAWAHRLPEALQFLFGK